jgi:hypothetical protein
MPCGGAEMRRHGRRVLLFLPVLVGPVTPLILAHGIEARYDDLLVMPKLPPLVRYSV